MATKASAAELDDAPVHHDMVRGFVKKFCAPSNEASATLIWDDARRETLGAVLRSAISLLYADADKNNAEAKGGVHLRVAPGMNWEFASFLAQGSYADLYYGGNDQGKLSVIVPNPSLPGGVSSSGEEPLVPGVFLDTFLNASTTEEAMSWPNLPLREFFFFLNADLFASTSVTSAAAGGNTSLVVSVVPELVHRVILVLSSIARVVSAKPSLLELRESNLVEMLQVVGSLFLGCSSADDADVADDADGAAADNTDDDTAVQSLSYHAVSLLAEVSAASRRLTLSASAQPTPETMAPGNSDSLLFTGHDGSGSAPSDRL